MEDTKPSKGAHETMSLKKLDDPASKDFWEYVEKSKQEWREQQPSWSRELQQQQDAPQAEASAPVEPPGKSVLCN